VVETFQTRDGVSLCYTLRRTGSSAVIVVVPGILMHRESVEHRLLRARLAPLADVATLDVRGHGDSGGAFTWGLREPEDVVALAGRLRRDYDRVAGVGFSFGGFHLTVGAGLAAGNPFDALAVVGTPARLHLLDHNPLRRGLARSLPLALRRRRRPARLSWRRRARRTMPWRAVEGVSPAPLLVVHGTDDWLVPEKHARRLFDHAREPKELRFIPGGLHAEYMLADDPEPLVAALWGFLAPRTGHVTAREAGSS
jgi:pimeloyl-ACP methyl ester carboxylesterase